MRFEIILISVALALSAVAQGERRISLIPCPDCGTEVSRWAVMCPKCGCPGEAIAESARRDEDPVQKDPDKFLRAAFLSAREWRIRKRVEERSA